VRVSGADKELRRGLGYISRDAVFRVALAISVQVLLGMDTVSMKK